MNRFIFSLKCSNLKYLDDLDIEFTDGWNTLLGDHAEKKLRVLQATAVGLVGASFSSAFWINWDLWAHDVKTPCNILTRHAGFLTNHVSAVRKRSVWDVRDVQYSHLAPATGFIAPSRGITTGSHETASFRRSSQQELHLLGLFTGSISQANLPIYLEERWQIPHGFSLPASKLKALVPPEFASLAPLVILTLDSLGALHASSPLTLRDDAGPGEPAWVCELPGIVLIDHVEREVHPRYHAQIPKWFAGHFPRVQFITTSNSAVVAEAGHRTIEGFDLKS